MAIPTISFFCIVNAILTFAHIHTQMQTYFIHIYTLANSNREKSRKVYRYNFIMHHPDVADAVITMSLTSIILTFVVSTAAIKITITFEA